MRGTIDMDVDWLDEVARTQPLPVADAALNLLCASAEPYERAQRIAELLRASLRWCAGVALAARLGETNPPRPDATTLTGAIETLRKRGALSDGGWRALARDLVAPWAETPQEHPVPGLVELLSDRRVSVQLDALLGFRNTMAHEPPATADEVRALIHEALPALSGLLQKLSSAFVATRLVLPLSANANAGQHAFSLMGSSPARGRWRRIELAPGVVVSSTAMLVDLDGRPVLALEPAIRVIRPSPDVPEEVYFLDGKGRRGTARYLSLPNSAEYEEGGVWDLLASRLGSAASAGSDRVDLPDEPFRGLESFDATHARVFVGRERETQELANMIRREPLVTLTGPSGVGKTSLLRAGVGPALDRRHAQLAALDSESGGIPGHRTQSRIPPRYAWVVVRPGTDPFAALEAAVRADLDEDIRAAASSAEWVERLLGWARAQRRVLVLVVDQAEELVTQVASSDERTRFADVLVSLGSAADLPSRVVISVRGDYFARLAELEPLYRRYDSHVYTLKVPAPADLRRILVEPLEPYKQRFESGLVESMVEATGATAAALPLLQFTAAQLWQRRDANGTLTRAAYTEIGGLDGALSQYADRVLDEQVPEGQRAHAEAVFLALVTAEGTRAVLTIEEICERTGADVTPVLEVLTRARLLTSRSGPKGERMYEVVHERLAESWTRLAMLRRANVAEAVRRDQLRDAARTWSDHSRSEDLLWRGDALAAHRSWIHGASSGLTAEERAFITASEGAERRTRRDRSLIVASVAVLLCVASLAIALIGRRATRSTAETMGRNLLLTQSHWVQTDVATALEQVDPVFATLGSIAGAAMPSQEALVRIQDAVKGRPGITAARIDFPVGVSWQTIVADPSTGAARLYELRTDAAAAELTEFSGSGWITSRSAATDPRTTSQYRQAMEAKTRVWFPPSVLSSGRTGLAVSEPLYGDDASVICVITIELDVEGLSAFIRPLPLAGARSLVFAQDGTVLAAPSHSYTPKREAGVAKRLLTYRDLDDIAVDALFAALGSDRRPQRFVDLDTAEGRYLASVVVLGGRQQQTADLFIATVVPDRTLSGPAERFQRDSLITSGIVMALLLLIAAVFYWTVVRRSPRRPLSS